MIKGALVIGIDHYPTSPLQGCVNDATDFADIIEINGDGSPNFSVRRSMNVSSKPTLKSLIVELFDREMDTALFYFSGHGFLNEIGGYIVTPDHRKYDEGVSMDEIMIIAGKSKIKNKIIILDCCHSGALGSPQLHDGAASYLAEGMVILTACRNNEESIEINGHGIFTNLLLEALKGGAADIRGHITPGSVYAYVDQALGPWDQRPIFKTNVSRFTSLRTVLPAVPVEILRKIKTYFPQANYEFSLDPTFEYTNKEIAKPENVAIFKHLQQYEGVNLVVPTGEEHMYWAAQNSKSCRLTTLGQHYWRLVSENRL